MLKRLNGRGLYWPNFNEYISGNPGVGTDVLNISGSRIAMIGQFWTPDNQNKVITGVQFRFGTVTKAGGTVMRVSLQNLLTGSAATGSPGQANNTPLDFFYIQNNDTTFATSTWCTGSLQTGVSMSFGQLFAVVFETSASGLQAGDSIGVAGINNLGSISGNKNGFSYLAKYPGSGSLWQASTSYPNVAFQCSDGTNGSFIGGFSLNNFSSVLNIATGSNPNEVGLRIKIPFSCSIDAVAAVILIQNNSSSFNVNFYDGGTDGNSSILLMTSSLNAGMFPTTLAQRYTIMPFATESILAPNHIYYATILPQTGSLGSQTQFQLLNVFNNNLWNINGATSESYQASRINGQSWSGSITQRPIMYLRLNQVDDGVISSIAPPIFIAPTIYGNLLYFGGHGVISHGTIR